MGMKLAVATPKRPFTDRPHRKLRAVLTFCIMFLIAAVIVRIFVWPVLWLILRFPTTTAEVMQANWSIRIPEGVDELADYDEPSIFGDGPRYTVLQDEGYMEFFSSFHDGPSAAAERFGREVMDSLNVPPEERPDFSHDYKWAIYTKDGSDRMFCVYDEEEKRYYFFEYFY